MYKGTGRRIWRLKSKTSSFTGTAHQIAWAREIYTHMLTNRARIVANCNILSLLTDRMSGRELAEWYLTHLSHRQKSAAWWIAHREDLSDAWFMGEYIQKYLLAPDAPDSRESLVQAEFLLRPKKTLYPGAVELIMEPDDYAPDQGFCLLRYERNSSFTQFARQLGMTWHSNQNAYRKKVDRDNAPLLDRCAEIGSRLLLAGFCVLPLDARVHTAICAGEFEWEHDRWILPGSSPTRLRLVFPKNRTLYQRVCTLGAFWTGKQVEVGVWHADALQELARLYNFRISPEASMQMENWRRLCLYGKTVEPEEPASLLLPDQDPIRMILMNDDPIPEDLIDDDD